jgi:molybdenum cofactor synthesis domain-containing protein
MSPNKSYRAGLITASTSAARGAREDVSGKVLAKILAHEGYTIVSAVVLPDDEKLLSAEMIRLADADLCDVIFTTGGTGLSESDVTPEATLAVAHKIVPGIPEAMRAYSMTLTKRAMLSRGAAVIRTRTLIVNLPGSPKAVRECLSYILGDLYHGIAILRGDTGVCAR